MTRLPGKATIAPCYRDECLHRNNVSSAEGVATGSDAHEPGTVPDGAYRNAQRRSRDTAEWRPRYQRHRGPHVDIHAGEIHPRRVTPAPRPEVDVLVSTVCCAVRSAGIDRVGPAL